MGTKKRKKQAGGGKALQPAQNGSRSGFSHTRKTGLGAADLLEESLAPESPCFLHEKSKLYEKINFVIFALEGLGGPKGRFRRKNKAKNTGADRRRQAPSAKKLLPPEGFHRKAAPARGFSRQNGSRSGLAKGHPIRSIEFLGDSNCRPARPVECAGQNAGYIKCFSMAWRALPRPKRPSCDSI